MARIGRCVGRGLGAGALVAVAVVGLGLVVPAGPAAAHARLVGSSPAPGSTVDRAPAEVSIELDAKPATIEGDPLQVYAPDGRRVDAGDPHVSEAGRRLAVTVDPARGLPAGAYHLAYRVVSADSHVISGRLSFTVRLPSGAGDVAAPGAPATDDPGAGSHRLVAAGAHDVRPPLVAAGALALAALALVVRVLWGLWARRARVRARRARARRERRRRPVPRAAAPPASRHPDRHRPGPRPQRRRATPHGRPPGSRARGHRPPPRTRPGPRRDLVPSGERRPPGPGDGWWP